MARNRNRLTTCTGVLIATAFLLGASLPLSGATTVFTQPTVISESNSTFDGNDIEVIGTTVTIDGVHTFNSLSVTNGGVLTHTACSTDAIHSMDITVATTLTVDSTSAIDVTGRGYLAGRTLGNTTVGAATSGGGSYGGLGIGGTNATYGDYRDPNELGSGGSYHVILGGRSGGGLVRLRASSLVLHGAVRADGEMVSGDVGLGNGSGGGIRIDVNTLSGTGAIQAAGGRSAGEVAGGGRIAIYARDTADFDLRKIATGGRPGTIYLKHPDEALGTLLIAWTPIGAGVGGTTPLGLPGDTELVLTDEVIVRGGGVIATPVSSVSSIELLGPLTIEESGTLAIPEGVTVVTRSSVTVRSGGKLTVAGDLDLQGSLSLESGRVSVAGTVFAQLPLVLNGGGVLECSRMETPALQLLNGTTLSSLSSTAETEYRLYIDVPGEVFVDGASAIDVTGRGYLAGRTLRNTTVGAASPGSGGSYGGIGQGNTNAIYGDFRNPSELGSGGGTGSPTHAGTAGGGLVHLKAPALILHGAVRANGDTNSFQSANGSGGGIRIDVEELSGTGTIQARGGSDLGSEGGGGRIAVYARDTTNFNLGNISTGRRPGTVYLRHPDETTGTLLIAATPLFGNALIATQLGLPGDTELVLTDEVIVRGGGAIATPVSSVTSIELQGPLTIEEQGALAVPEGVTVVTRSSVTVRSSGKLTVAEALFASLDLTIDGSTLEGGRIEAPGLNLISALARPVPSTTTRVYTLDLCIAGDISVDANSAIAADHRGYLVGRTLGNTTVGGAKSGAGGSHGGRGGGASPMTYGDFLDPETAGSGGGGGAGGGIIRLRAAALHLDGNLTANPEASGSGGGAGGSISVDVDQLTGGGRIQAIGNPTHGGGGRIAVYALSAPGFLESRLRVEGSGAGQVGTAKLFPFARRTHGRSFQPVGLYGGYFSQGLDHVDIHFNQPVDLTKARLNQFVIDGPLGAITPTGFSEVGDRLYRLPFPQQEQHGRYNFTVVSTLLDADGFSLDQNGNGNPGELNVDDYRFTLVIDKIGPRVTQHFPDQDITGTVDYVDVWFSEPMDPTTFTPADVVLLDPSQNPVSITTVESSEPSRFRFKFAPLAAVGRHSFRLAADIRDLAGNKVRRRGWRMTLSLWGSGG